MKDKQEAQAVYELAAVLLAVESAQAARSGIGVGELRLLVRVAALTGAGAVVTGSDLVRVWPTARNEVTTYGARLRKAGYLVRVGRVKLGSWELTREGRGVCESFARAVRRGRAQLMSFEQISPFRRVVPLV